MRMRAGEAGEWLEEQDARWRFPATGGPPPGMRRVATTAEAM
jgi:hypothetical protein